MWTFCVAFLVFSHLHDFGVNTKAVIDDNAIDSQQIEAINLEDTSKHCIYISSTPGYLTYKAAPNSTDVCGIFLVTDSRNLIEITFTEFDVPCGKNKKEGDLVQYIDGWEIDNDVFPSQDVMSTYSSEDNEFCSDNKPLHKKFISSQNAAQITYDISQIGKGFTIFVNHRKHPSPCNIIHFDEPYYLLQNHGQNKNCSLWALYPTVIQFNSYNVGHRRSEASNSTQCANAVDHIEIGGGGFDTNRIEILDTVCGKSEANDFREDSIICSTTMITLVSSGTRDNKVNISMHPMVISENEIADPTYLCSM